MEKKIDSTDLTILRQLQKDSRQSLFELADAAGLSKSACHRRLKLLEENGTIDHYAAVLNPSAIGFDLTFVVEVTLQGQSEKSMKDFEREVARLPQVLECQLMTGQYDYNLRVAARSAEDYEATHHRLARLPGVSKLQSSLALRTVKAFSGLPV